MVGAHLVGFPAVGFSAQISTEASLAQPRCAEGRGQIYSFILVKLGEFVLNHCAVKKTMILYQIILNGELCFFNG